MEIPFLTTRDLSKNFGETKALRQVSIELEKGKVHTVLGENGSGKSTLVKVLSGVLPPDSGEISLDGQVIAPASPAEAINLGIVVVLQEVLVARNRSVIDNVLMGQDSLFSYSKNRAEKRAYVSEVLSGLTDRKFDLEQNVDLLPLNEQQILVVARGFARQPKLLILDEVTAALDLADRDRLFLAIRKFCTEGGTVVFVSHRMPEIMELSDHVIIMHNGLNTATLSGKDINPDTLLKHLTQEGLDE